MKPAALGKVLEETLERMELKRALREKLALFVWEETVGPDLARHTRPARVQRGVMTVETSSPAWSQQLTLLKPGLLEAINKRLGERLIKDLRFHSGQGLSVPGPVLGERPVRPAGRPQPAPLSAEELAEVDEQVSVISDPALRARWRRLVLKAKAARDEHAG